MVLVVIFITCWKYVKTLQTKHPYTKIGKCWARIPQNTLESGIKVESEWNHFSLIALINR